MTLGVDNATLYVSCAIRLVPAAARPDKSVHVIMKCLPFDCAKCRAPIGFERYVVIECKDLKAR